MVTMTTAPRTLSFQMCTHVYKQEGGLIFTNFPRCVNPHHRQTNFSGKIGDDRMETVMAELHKEPLIRNRSIPHLITEQRDRIPGSLDCCAPDRILSLIPDTPAPCSPTAQYLIS